MSLNLASNVVSLTIPGIYVNWFSSYMTTFVFCQEYYSPWRMTPGPKSWRPTVLRSSGFRIRTVRHQPPPLNLLSAQEWFLENCIITLTWRFCYAIEKNTKFCQGGREYYSVNCTGGAQIFITSDRLINFGYFNRILIRYLVLFKLVVHNI